MLIGTAVTALKRRINDTNIKDGAVFRSIDQWGNLKSRPLIAQSINANLKSRTANREMHFKRQMQKIVINGPFIKSCRFFEYDCNKLYRPKADFGIAFGRPRTCEAALLVGPTIQLS